MSYNINIRC